MVGMWWLALRCGGKVVASVGVWQKVVARVGVWRISGGYVANTVSGGNVVASIGVWQIRGGYVLASVGVWQIRGGYMLAIAFWMISGGHLAFK